MTGSISVEVNGVGQTIEEAQKSGFRDAIQEAYGTLMLSERRIKNDSLFEDDISYAKGVIEKYTIILKEYNQNDRSFHLKMKVTVSPTSIKRRLLDAQDAQSVNGGLLGKQIAIGQAQATSEVDRYLGARKLFEHVSSNIGRNIFDVKVGQVKTIRDGQKISTTVDVDVEANQTTVENLCLATREYHNARVKSTVGNYNSNLKNIWVKSGYKCSTGWMKVENDHFLKIRDSLLSVGFCMEIISNSSSVISRTFSNDWKLVDDGWVPSADLLPQYVKGYSCGTPDGCYYDTVGEVGVTHDYIKINKGGFTLKKTTFPIMIPILDKSAINSIAEIKVKITTQSECR
ncbi:hypothetical protein [Rhodoferax sp. OV413]|uniref:hypothetical protein n=1 Tax=Rhodoferax sp. OV413 TaxID=1855285 RepID=UPI0025DBD34F|nr:hypothetical protein [Rhodoferax sp. OV413]